MRVRRPWVSGLVCGVVVGLCASGVGSAANEAGIDPKAAEFFETRVRPVLAENCFSCHGGAQQMAGLRLDSRAFLLKGSQKGLVLVAGDPEKSALIRAVRYVGNVKMPPQGRLPEKAIEALTAWVKMGAPWPEARVDGTTGGSTGAPEEAHHWSFQPVKRPPLPRVRNTAWPASPIDTFIVAALEKHGLQPAAPIEKRSLLRRATFDLTGLPPTPEEIDAFAADRSPQAFARVVDRLLASPRYGERWGRHWLDVARYADTKGYFFAQNTNYPHAYTYRDWVIRAFNSDLPYNQFIIQQLAADRLLLGRDKRPLAAMGFLTVGGRFQDNEHDIIDDRIDVMTRGLMGLTVSCARCHNHKFDPIPTNDYYSLYGVFASSIEPDPAIISPAARADPFLAHEKRIKALEADAEVVAQPQQKRLRLQFLGAVPDYLLAIREFTRQPDQKPLDAWARERGLNPVVLQKWRGYLAEVAPPPLFRPWHAFAALPESSFAAEAAALAPKLAANNDPAAPLNPFVAQMLQGPPPASLREVAARYGALLAASEKGWQEALRAHAMAAAQAIAQGKEAPTPLTALPSIDEEAVRQVLYGNGSPLQLSLPELEPYFDASARDQLKELRKQIKALRDAAPPAPEYAMVLADAPTPRAPKVFIRGNPGNPGEEVPRRFLQILAGKDRQPFRYGSGRLELAWAIASRSNPLTARVVVNRIWMHHFGEGLVRTPGDFGKRSEPPTHPDLLDYLAWRFMEDGWSIKKLHRLIMLSSAYRMGSDLDARGLRVDPENRLLWRMNRRRLELEALRDTLLAAAGRLDKTIGGPSVELTKSPFATRRTVYGYIERPNLQGLFRTFDFASPEASVAQRHQTTVPQQALFMMNSPFVVEQARHLARRRDLLAYQEPERRIRYLYRLLYGRLPSAKELAMGLRYLRIAPEPDSAARPEPVWRYGYGAYDPAAQRVTTFRLLAHWTGQAWQGSTALPDATLGRLQLTATGGHAGPDARHAAIRRWVAPRDAEVTILGTLRHAGSEGDGVQAWIVSSRSGELGRWTAHGGAAETTVARVAVRRGDTIDFVVDCRLNDEDDSFTWAPTITPIGPAVVPVATSPPAAETWGAEAEFGGPPEAAGPLSPWEEYVQVLMMANEFAFVD